MEFYREMSAPVYKRVLLKISGESLQGNKGHGYDPEAVASVAARIREALETGVEIALVVGAGNIWRGLANSKGGMDRVTADQMGMLATAMNALCLKEAFRQAGVDCAVHSAVGMEPFLPRYNRDEALRQLAEHKLVLFACGTGSPFFTTDTTAALRGAEIGADIVVLKELFAASQESVNDELAQLRAAGCLCDFFLCHNTLCVKSECNQ